MRIQCKELSREELNLVLLGQISALLSHNQDTNARNPLPRQRSSMEFYHGGIRICRKTFQKLHGIGTILQPQYNTPTQTYKHIQTHIQHCCTVSFYTTQEIFLVSRLPKILTAAILHLTGKDRFMALKASYLVTGLTTRVHGNSKRLPKHALKLEEIKNLVTFLSNFAEKNAILLPGRIPGYKRDDLQLLPSNTTKKVPERAFLICIHSLCVCVLGGGGIGGCERN